MSKRKGVTPNFRELMADLKPMTFGQKLDHLWSYYKEWLLVAFLIGVVIAMLVSGIVNSKKEYLFKGLMINISMTQEGYRYVTDDLLASLSDGDKNHTILFDYTNFKSLADPTSSDDNYAATMVMIARVGAELMDCALLDQLAFEFYMGQEVYGDLRDCFTQEQLDALGDRVIYLMMESDEEEAEEDPEEETQDPAAQRWPAAIRVTDMPFFKDAAPDNEAVYLVISANKPNREAVQAFWAHLNAWQKSE